MSKQMVQCWCRQFTASRHRVHDEERSGRPPIITNNFVEWKRIMENHLFTIMVLSSHFLQILRSLLHKIVVEYLLLRKLCTRWMPKHLTSEHKAKCIESALTFLHQYHDDGDEFLDRIITGDEMWAAHTTPETKLQPVHWHRSGYPWKTKFKQTLSTWKVMYMVF